MNFTGIPTRTEAEYRRLGGLMHDGEVERFEPVMRWRRAVQIAATWRSHLAWHLANALGWRGTEQRPTTAGKGRP